MNRVEGEITARGRRFAIVVSKFNELITNRLLAGAVEALKAHGASEDALRVVCVPGAFEIPVVAKRLARSQQFHAVICLGAVVRGETPHFDYICAEAARGIARTMLETEIPIVFGVLTTNTVDQALARSGTAERNRGADAARTAMEMVSVLESLPPSTALPHVAEDDPLECW